MANPVPITLPVGVWTKVADSVVSGRISIKDWQADNYFQDYRIAGDPAPTDNDTAAIMFKPEASISAKEDIDVYMQARIFEGKVIIAV